MEKMTTEATSVNDWKYLLNEIASFLKNNLKDIDKIRIVSRCSNCFKKNSDVSIKFNGENLTIKRWSYDCNVNKKEANQTISIDSINLEDIVFPIEEGQHHFALKMHYHMFNSSYITYLSGHYPIEDYEIHGEMQYKDRKIKMKEREVNNGIVLLLEDFIDFKGLVPKYCHTLHITFKGLKF